MVTVLGPDSVLLIVMNMIPSFIQPGRADHHNMSESGTEISKVFDKPETHNSMTNT